MKTNQDHFNRIESFTRTHRNETTDGQAFLDRLATMSGEGFQARFSRISTRLGLGVALNAAEPKTLYEAAYFAALCHIAFNGLGGCSREIKPEREFNRSKLEQHFMDSRDKLWASAKWQALPLGMQTAIQQIFLTAYVEEDNLSPD
jgi:hypothetical protein